ncbi:MAG TPA: histidinol-phosphate transaminase [Polyangiaceae bacterium]|nr:histidinol-phosphate transaminase [Polyangiaceae bacterium]
MAPVHFRNCVEAMQAYVPGEQPQGLSRLIKLNTNENPYPPSPAVAQAIADELQGDGNKLRLYSDPWATALRQEAGRLHGFPTEQILHGNGSDELLALLVRSLVEPGEKIAFPYPTYVLYETLASAQGAVHVTVDFDPQFNLPEGLDKLGAKIVFIASPNSPSGTRHPVDRLQKLARGLKDGVLVIDEAYADFAASNALELAKVESNVVVLRTFSKSYSLAGMRLGLLFASQELVAGITKIKDSYNLDRLAIVAGAAALRDQAWMRANVARIQRSRAQLVSGLTALGMQVLPSEANFVFARLSSAERAAAAYQFLKDRGILVRYFSMRLLNDGLRITVGTDDEVSALLQALGEFS